MSDRFEQLSAYLDGELDAAERRAFEERLEHDAALRAELNTFKRLSNELHIDDADRRAAQAIKANLQRRRRRRWRAWLPALPLAVLLLAAVLLWPRFQAAPTITTDDLFNEYAEAVLALGE